MREPPKQHTIYLLMSTATSQHRVAISTFVMEQGHIPLYPSMIADYYPGLKTHQRDAGGRESDDLFRKADEIWVVGAVNQTLSDQIAVAKRLRKTVRFFDFDSRDLPDSITEIDEDDAEFEQRSGKK